MRKEIETSPVHSHRQEHTTAVKQCPLCSTDYDPTVVHVLEEWECVSMIHVTCGKCKHAVVAVVGSTGAGVGLLGLVTDLNCEDAVRFRRREPITDDELLEQFCILREQTRECAEYIITQANFSFSL